MYKRTGFTLIELLVVIAVIALLLGILLPALKKARKQALSVVCGNNLKQVGTAASMYAEDYNLYIPRSAEYGKGMQPWFQLFMPYLSQKAIDDDYRNVDIFRCPSYPNDEQTVCYVVNGWRDSAFIEPGRSKITECKLPASTIYLADNEDGPWRNIITNANQPDVAKCDVFHPDHLPDSDSENIGTGRRVARERHRTGCNVIFLDWHVGYMDAEDMTVEDWLFD